MLQFSVTATRFGTYGLAKKALATSATTASDDGRASVWARNVVLAAVSGGLGAIAGNVWFRIKTRHQVYASGSRALAVGAQHKPLPVFREAAKLVRDEGVVSGLFRGLDAFMPRVVIYGAAQLSTYDWFKARLQDWRSPAEQQLAASVGAALASVTAIQPFDWLAVRLQNQPVDPLTRKGLYYASPLDCLVKCVRAEGPLCVFKGFSANLTRFAPYTVLIFFFVERLKRVF